MAPYGISKYCAEQYLLLSNRLYQTQHVILRYGNVFGPRQDPHGEAGVVAIFFGRLLEGVPPVIFGDGSQTRDYVAVPDVVRANLAALDYRGPETTFNIGTQTETSVVDLLAACQAAAGTSVEPQLGPGTAGRAGSQLPGLHAGGERASLAACDVAGNGPRADARVAAAVSVVSHRPELTEKLIAVTFDDGPSRQTPAILDVLAEHDALATFFVLGERVEGKEDVLGRIMAEGEIEATPTAAPTRSTSTTASWSTTSAAVSGYSRPLEPVVMRPPYGRGSGAYRAPGRPPGTADHGALVDRSERLSGARPGCHRAGDGDRGRARRDHRSARRLAAGDIDRARPHAHHRGAAAGASAARGSGLSVRHGVAAAGRIAALVITWSRTNSQRR